MYRTTFKLFLLPALAVALLGVVAAAMDVPPPPLWVWPLVVFGLPVVLVLTAIVAFLIARLLGLSPARRRPGPKPHAPPPVADSDEHSTADGHLATGS